MKQQKQGISAQGYRSFTTGSLRSDGMVLFHGLELIRHPVKQLNMFLNKVLRPTVSRFTAHSPRCETVAKPSPYAAVSHPSAGISLFHGLEVFRHPVKQLNMFLNKVLRPTVSRFTAYSPRCETVAKLSLYAVISPQSGGMLLFQTPGVLGWTVKQLKPLFFNWLTRAVSCFTGPVPSCETLPGSW